MHKSFLSIIDQRSADIINLANTIWENPELSFHEFKSSQAIMDFLIAEGFKIEKNIAGIPTAFVASYGSGKPEIGFIAEFDALSGLSQEANVFEQRPIPGIENGHGCGHNFYGGTAVAAALAVKGYLASGHPGTVKVLGCPGEEGGSGKAFMARVGAFSNLDAAMGGHPERMWAVRTRPSLANAKVRYTFAGIAAHAGSSPHKGRSALDAVELMNVAVNFLREHMPADNRVHYAITDAGGVAPNVVQSHAEVLYMMRASDNQGVLDLMKRVDKCAQGAALATETEVTSKFISADSNLITIPTLQKTLYHAMCDIDLPVPTAEELEYGKKLASSFSNNTENQKIYADQVQPLPEYIAPHFGSTDTGDVSWNCPTVQMHVGTWVIGTIGHSWQAVTQGKSSFSQKAMLYAGKALALCAMRLMENPELLRQAKAEQLKKTGGKYLSIIPQDVMPEI